MLKLQQQTMQDFFLNNIVKNQVEMKPNWYALSKDTNQKMPHNGLHQLMVTLIHTELLTKRCEIYIS